MALEKSAAVRPSIPDGHPTGFYLDSMEEGCVMSLRQSRMTMMTSYRKRMMKAFMYVGNFRWGTYILELIN